MIDPGTATKVGIDVVKVVPWGPIFSWIKAMFSPRVAIIGPTRSGKTTFVRVINNQGRLVPLIDHKSTTRIRGAGTTKMKLRGNWGETELLLRNLDDTPGHRGAAANVVQYLLSYTPKVLIVVVDVSRPFTEEAEMAEADTAKWFDAIRSEGLMNPQQFREFIRNLACVLVLMNKFDRAHATLTQETAGNIGDLHRKLEEHERYYRNEINNKFYTWLELGAKQPGDIPITYFKCCLVTYPGKTITQYDEGHLSIFENAYEALKTDRHQRAST